MNLAKNDYDGGSHAFQTHTHQKPQLESCRACFLGESPDQNENPCALWLKHFLIRKFKNEKNCRRWMQACVSPQALYILENTVNSQMIDSIKEKFICICNSYASLLFVLKSYAFNQNVASSFWKRLKTPIEVFVLDFILKSKNKELLKTENGKMVKFSEKQKPSLDSQRRNINYS